jgi:hypothetical protein
MIPYEIDPSLHNGEPEPTVLDDGFSPPHGGEPAANSEQPPTSQTPVDAALPVKSLF